MRTNKDRSVILIENPLTGNDSFASAMGLNETAGMAKYVRPRDVRSAMPREQWGSAQKVVLVRDPRERFESGVTLAFIKAGSEEFTDEFNALLSENEGRKPEDRANAVLEFLASSPDLAPEFFAPQSRWLTSKFDVVLATRDIAEYFNRVVGKCCVKKNPLRSNPAFRAFRGQTTSPLLKKVYADDYALFEKLKVWSPDPLAIRLVEGYCKRCMENEGKFVGLIGGGQLEEAETTIETPAETSDTPTLHVRAKRKRRKPSSIEAELGVIDTDTAAE